MSTATISLYKSTWILEGNSANHVSDTLLRTNIYAKNVKNYIAVLQFSIPSQYKYKHITRAQLSFYTQTSAAYGKGVQIAPYVAGDVLSTLTGANVDANGTLGERITLENILPYSGSYPSWRTVDVTSLINSNLYSGYFTLFVSAMPGMPSSGDTTRIHGVGATYPATLTIDYEDVAQLPPTPTYPVGAYVNENTDILFAWAWNSSTQAVQTAVQLEYKAASADSWTVVSLTQSGHTYELSGGLPQGGYQWRIKATNDASETSDYSSIAEFTVIGKPAAPVINDPANAALTEITWQANDQNSYDITLADAEGTELIKETVASSASSYKPNMLLKGSYTVGIRYRNSTGLSSDWSYKAFAITASGPAKPAMTLYGDGENARIAISPASGIKYALMRAEDTGDKIFQIVGLFEGSEYTDRTARFNVPYIYKVRAYASAGYTDSDNAYFRSSSEKVRLHAGDIDISLTKSDQEFKPYSEDTDIDMAVYRCPGRRYPIVEHGEVESWIFTSSLHASEAQKEALKLISKENYIYYRDYAGRAFPVAIQRLSFSRWMNDGYIARIEFIRIDEKEVIVNV